MLCSAHAKQPEVGAALGSSFVMKHLRLVFILALVAAIVAACGGGGKPSVPNNAVAVVGDATITKADYTKVLDQAKKSYAAQKRPFPKPGTTEYSGFQAQIMKYLVERVEYTQAAKDHHIKVSEKEVTDRLDQIKQQYFASATPGQKPLSKAQVEQKYRAQLKAQGVSDKDVRDGIRSQLLREKLYNDVTKDVKVSDDDAKKYYDDHKKQYEQPATPASRDVRHILVKSHAKALAIYGQLKGGADFAKLALRFSIDPSKSNGGRLTVCKQQSVTCLKTVAPFEATAFSLKPNEISKPVHTRFGWHVIQALGPVKAPTKAQAQPFDKVKAQIKPQLLQQKKQKEFTKWWNDAQKDFAKKTAYQTGYAPPSTSTTPTTTTG
jgi:foldase protein PrsA